jgi:hypothetical protein
MNALGVKLRLPRVLIAITAAILFSSLLVTGWRHFHPRQTVNYPYLASIIEIRKLVAYPETAVYSQFGRDPDATVHLRHDGDYEVTGWVEEENDHGNRVRRDWRCVVHPEGGDHWLPVYVHLDQFTAGTYVPEGDQPPNNSP